MYIDCMFLWFQPPPTYNVADMRRETLDEKTARVRRTVRAKQQMSHQTALVSRTQQLASTTKTEIPTPGEQKSVTSVNGTGAFKSEPQESGRCVRIL